AALPSRAAPHPHLRRLARQSPARATRERRAKPARAAKTRASNSLLLRRFGLGQRLQERSHLFGTCRSLQQTVTWLQRPLNSGLRFSVKAVRPSFASSDANAR